MAKLPPTERFRIRCEVEAAQLGPAVAELTRLGLTNVHFELVTDDPIFAKKTHHEVKAEDFLMAWTADHPTFAVRDAIANFRANGRSDGACYTAVRMLVEAKTLKKLGPGNYARADVKAIAPPEKKPERKTASFGHRYDVSNGEFILRLAKKAHGRISLEKLKKAFAADEERNVASVNPTINDLVKKKKLKRDDDGMLELIPDASAKLNGAATAEGVTLHG